MQCLEMVTSNSLQTGFLQTEGISGLMDPQFCVCRLFTLAL